MILPFVDDAQNEAKAVAIYRAAKPRKTLIPLFEATIQAGFPSPAEDFSEKFDLAAHLVKNHASTFFMRVAGDSMTGRGIFSGDILVVDKSLTPRNGDIVIAVINSEFTIKTFRKIAGRIELHPENSRFKKITFEEGQELEIWGVVTNCVKDFR